MSIACPACKSESTAELFAVTAAEAAAHFLGADHPARLALENTIQEQWRQPACSIKSCTSCGFGFAHPYVAGSPEFYAAAFPRSGYPSERYEFTRTVQRLRQIGGGGAILEVGAGVGAFIKKVSPSMFAPENVWALEYHDYALSALRRLGVNTRQGDIRAVDLPQAHFDHIVMFQVLEHLDATDQLFQRLRSLVKPGGRIFIGVPNIARTRYQEANRSLVDMPPNHIGRWTPAALASAARPHRIKLIASETEPFSLADFIKTDIIYSYLRAAQTPGSMAARARKLRDGKIGKLAGATMSAAYAPMRIPVWLRNRKTLPALGMSMWAELQAQ